MQVRLALTLTTLGVLAACGPVPVEVAERNCLVQARGATGPHGKVGVGVRSDGKPALRGEINVSSDFLQGRDPAEVFNTCVYDKSGQFPTRPLYSMPDWKG